MSVVAEVFAGLGSGVLSGVGELAVKIREAITGEGIVDGAKKGELLVLAAQLEATLKTAELQLQLAQIEINKADAQSNSLFRGGWRPFAGWLAVAGCVGYPIARTIFPWTVQVGALALGWDASQVPPLPTLDTTEIFAVLGTLLGFGGYRSFERVKGKS